MVNYSSDRSFTDYVHNHLAIPIIYKALYWKLSNVEPEILNNMDVKEGIDYVFTSKSGEMVLVQERFRDSFYAKYNDATLRFRRDKNLNADRVESEFYKIKANYLVYGITNGSKFPEKRHTLTNFNKWVVLDLEFIKKQYRLGSIQIITDSRIYCWEKDGVLFCPENFNPDGSSSFIPFDILLLKKIWGHEPFKPQNGYF